MRACSSDLVNQHVERPKATRAHAGSAFPEVWSTGTASALRIGACQFVLALASSGRGGPHLYLNLQTLGANNLEGKGPDFQVRIAVFGSDSHLLLFCEKRQRERFATRVQRRTPGVFLLRREKGLFMEESVIAAGKQLIRPSGKDNAQTVDLRVTINEESNYNPGQAGQLSGCCVLNVEHVEPWPRAASGGREAQRPARGLREHFHPVPSSSNCAASPHTLPLGGQSQEEL